MAKPKVLAFAGPGESTPENTTALLNDFLGWAEDGPTDDQYDEVVLLLPLTDSHLSGGLKSVLEWGDEYELAFDAITDGESTDRVVKKYLKLAENVEETANVNQSLIDALKENAHESAADPFLVLLWGEEGDENAEILLDLATSYGIKALDLSAGLDDIAFGEEEEVTEEPVPEPEPEPEPEKPARRSRRGAAAKAEATAGTKDEGDAEFEAKEKANAPDPEPEKPVRRSRAKKAEEIGPTPEGEPTLQEQIAEAKQVQADKATAAEWAKEQIEKSKNADFDNRFSHHPPTPEAIIKHAAIREQARAFAQLMEDVLPASREKSVVLTKIEEAMFWANAAIARNISAPGPDGGWDAPRPEAPQETAEEAPKGRGRPRKDGAPAQPRSAAQKAVTEYWDEDDQKWVRMGRGRPPKDVTTRKVDAETGEPLDEPFEKTEG